MGDEAVNEPRDPVEVRFSWIKEQVADINHNVNLLVEAVINNLGIFLKEEGSNSEKKLEGGLGDREEADN